MVHHRASSWRRACSWWLSWQHIGETLDLLGDHDAIRGLVGAEAAVAAGDVVRGGDPEPMHHGRGALRCVYWPV